MIGLIRELTADPDDAGQVVRLWCGTVDCVITGVHSYIAPDGEPRLDLEFVNRAQAEPRQ